MNSFSKFVLRAVRFLSWFLFVILLSCGLKPSFVYRCTWCSKMWYRCSLSRRTMLLCTSAIKQRFSSICFRFESNKFIIIKWFKYYITLSSERFDEVLSLARRSLSSRYTSTCISVIDEQSCSRSSSTLVLDRQALCPSIEEQSVFRSTSTMALDRRALCFSIDDN